MMTFDRITSNPVRMNGQPCIRNLRLTVRRVLELVALYPTARNFVGSTPNWKRTTSSKRWFTRPPHWMIGVILMRLTRECGSIDIALSIQFPVLHLLTPHVLRKTNP